MAEKKKGKQKSGAVTPVVKKPAKPKTPVKKAAVKKAAVKKTPVKESAAKPAVKKAAVKKAAIKKAPAKKVAAKPAVKKPTVKKVAVNVIAAQKPAVKTQPTKQSAPKTARTLFFTGFLGFIGKRLVRDLLDQAPDTRFFFLVQSKFVDEATQAITEIAKSHPGLFAQSEILAGDLTEENFALTKKDLATIQDKATEIWHLAAVYNLSISEQTAFRINVEGTRRILELAKSLKTLDRFVYFSTCFVSGTRKGLILENELDRGQSFKNHYESTKFEAEVMVREAMNEIPTIIIRPSVVIGDSKTGETDKFDGPYYFLRALAKIAKRGNASKIKLPLVGNKDVFFNLVPVDYLSATTVKIANDAKNIGSSFHVCDPEPLTITGFLELAYQTFGFGKPLPNIPEALLKLAGNFPDLVKASGFPPQLLPYTYHYAVYDNTNVKKALEGTKVDCPNLKDYFSVISKFVKENVQFKGGAKY